MKLIPALNLLLVTAFTSLSSLSQAQTLFSFKTPAPQDLTINTLHLKLSDSDYSQLKASRGKKIAISNVTAQVHFTNGDQETLSNVILETRGQSCLGAVRRCYDIKFENKVVANATTRFKEKSFNLVSMWQDRGYVSNQISFEILRKLNLFDLKMEYATLTINGQSEGLYLVMQKPQQAIKEITKDAWIARRGYSGSAETKEEAKSASTQALSAYYKSIYTDLKSSSADYVAQSLNQKMNLAQYFSWLTINSLLKNGDYSDEVYVYIDAANMSKKVEIFPWDFDDVFKKPHTSKVNTEHAALFETSLIYNLENPIDRAIQFNSILNNQFKATADQLLNKQIDDRFISEVTNTVRQRILPYLARQDVLMASKLDGGQGVTAQTVEGILKLRSQQLRERLKELRLRTQ